MNEGTLILSDLHLGRPRHGAPSGERLRPLWQGVRTLVLNGDIAELHHPRHRGHAARETLRLIELCDADGVETVLLSGNHDPFISDHRHLELAGGQVFVTHGDVLHPAVAPWSPRAGRMRQAQREALAALSDATGPGASLESRLRAAQHASHVEWEELANQALHSSIRAMLTRPWALVQVLWYWRRFPEVAAAFAAEHCIDAPFIITGHTHHAGIWRVGNRTIINTGSFGFPGRPLAVRIDALSMQVIDVQRRAGRYALSTSPRAIYPLAPSPAQPALPSAANTREVSGRLSAISA